MKIKDVPIISGIIKSNYPIDHIAIQCLKTIIIILSSTYYMSLMDALAWYRMPRNEYEMNPILPDIGFTLIPYNCPLESPDNIQTYILKISIMFNVVCAIYSKNGLFVIQRCIHLTSIACILKGSIECLTSYPNPNPVCSSLLEDKQTLLEIAKRVMGTIPSHSCGNLMFSGHASSLTLFLLVEGKYNIIRNANKGCFRLLLIMRIIKTLMGYYSIIACRSHYTTDIAIGIMITWFIFIVSETHFSGSKTLTTIEMQPYKKIMSIKEKEEKEEKEENVWSLSEFGQL
jgi:hypothetical protein